MQKFVTCSDCKEKCTKKKSSICSICFNDDKETYLCPYHYDKGLERAKQYTLEDGNCLCYNCWVTWFDENIDFQ